MATATARTGAAPSTGEPRQGLPQTDVLTDWNAAWVGSDAVVAFASAVMVELPLAAYLVRHGARSITEAARPAVVPAQSSL